MQRLNKDITYDLTLVHSKSVTLNDKTTLDDYDELGMLILTDNQFRAIQTELGVCYQHLKEHYSFNHDGLRS